MFLCVAHVFVVHAGVSVFAPCAPGLANLSPAEQYLSWADWTVVRTPDCSRTVRHKLHRCMGRLFIVKGNLEGALFHLANDVSQSQDLSIITMKEFSAEQNSDAWKTRLFF